MKKPQLSYKSGDLRTKQMSFFLTPEDALSLQEYAKAAGFKSSSQLVTAIMERLMIGGFTPVVFFKLGLQLRNFASQNGAYDKTSGFYFGVRPLPALPDEHLPTEEWKKEVSRITAEMEKEERKHQTNA